MFDPFDDQPRRRRRGMGGGMFRPTSVRGGRVQVYGCAPGCLLASLVISVVLTILINLLIRAF